MQIEQLGLPGRERFAHIGEIGGTIGDRANEAFDLALGLLDSAVDVASVEDALRPPALHLRMVFADQQ
ncbi:hypothetical protein [Sphingomonas sp. Leaf10]|uniref:hypothetical protein n=1 Tax=Sphingomonas sp. Leaf10 TaxID=1735676 RepID=UPI0006F83FAE|nr:hypothetical protein [Sphingomonas sp. Leaf10]KQM41139.1 hypothetical protein ASE59_02325 [Sphingomonas sp. Leaf10]